MSVGEAVSLRDLHTAWREARRGKRPSDNQLAFEHFWIDGLLDLQRELNAGTWEQSPPTCFIAKLPKAREIHAPDFRDRVVHHWLVPRLERICEQTFIFDSFSNRKGKGTHAAVQRLQTFVRQVESGQGGGWYLQLDIHNFFNSIHRPTLYELLKKTMTRHGVPLPLKRAVHALLRRSPLHDGVIERFTAAERALVPSHKRLANAGPGCGISIGNLSSQFFANVYLSALDQFVKHTLKAKRYLRYVDDFVLVHESREQLASWQAQIEDFLRDRLRLKLKAEVKLRPLESGIDFL
ncbi:MAG TPA: reverse transcriptase domain-containing protein, partial [Gammaproteobacteria bacterium]|nr:reverse transcriptase domain-containing protein [Gammaproteobacteria bacterium]